MKRKYYELIIDVEYFKGQDAILASTFDAEEGWHESNGLEDIYGEVLK